MTGDGKRRERGRSGGAARALFSSLGLSLFLWLFAVIILAFLAYASVSLRTTARQWNETVLQGAQRFSDLIQHSTHYSMLLNRKEDVHHAIRTIAQSPGVVGVRIYDKHGVIIFSADEAEIGRRVDLQAEACVSCHGQQVPLRSVPVRSRSRIFPGPDGTRILGLINPIENAPECSNAACHFHPAQQSVLGVLDVRMSMADPDARLATAKREAVLAAVLTTLLAGLVSAGFILKMVRRPVRQLISGTARVAGGDLDTEIRVDSHDEIGELAEAFNRMTRDLRETRRALTEWSGAVEAKLQEKTSELSRTQRHVAHMDKMASLGKLSATVAHELNNPLAGILNYAKLVMRGLETQPLDPAERRDLYRYLGVIQKEADRCGKIVRNMLLVARPTAGAFVPNSLNRIIDRSVMLVGHHLEISNVQLAIQGIGADDELVCDADGIQQALVALLINAVESMPDGGMIRLSAEREGEGVRLTISDTGCGIPLEALPHIFEPFFSTKTGASGLGLGLSVVYGIVEQHQGTIDVESNVNEGTTFRVLLPNRPPGDEAVAEASASTGPGITGGG